tara:strand:+ start:54 stop:557 length:504 start_codon:yes stop_codon:yes gene_type:complete
MKIAGYILIGIGVLDFALGWMGVDITGFAESPILFGVIGGFLLYFAKNQDKAVGLSDQLSKGEVLIKSSANAAVQLGLTKQEAGFLILSNKRIIFTGTAIATSGKLNQDSDEIGSSNFDISLEEITSTETSFKYLTLKDRNNAEFKVVVMGKKKWKNAIIQAISEYS